MLKTVLVVAGARVGSVSAERAASAARRRRARAGRSSIALVVNRDSGSARLARRAGKALHREGVVVLSEEHTTGSGLDGALDRAIKLLPPHGRLVVAGGDGTIGRATVFAAQHERLLAILPTGTGNDVARSIGLSLHPEQAAAFAASANPMGMDLGGTDEGGFAHALSLGMTADFAEEVQTVHGWRRPLVYPARAWRVWRRRGRLDVTIKIDSVELPLPYPPFQVAVVNAPRLGGRVGLTLPGASAHDGYLHVIAIYRGGLRRSLGVLIHFFRTGVASIPAGAFLGAGRRVEIASRAHHRFALDGEPAGCTPLAAWVLPGALQVVAPDSRFAPSLCRRL